MSKKTGIVGTAVILSILAIVLLQIFSFAMNAFYGTKVVALGVPLTMFIVLLLVLLPYKYLFEAPLTSGKSLAVTVVAILLVIFLMWVFPKVVPQIFSPTMSSIKMSVLK